MNGKKRASSLAIALRSTRGGGWREVEKKMNEFAGVWKKKNAVHK
jgi:hypothetical protein